MKNKLKYICLLLIAFLFVFTVSGCVLSPEDCYVFSDEEFIDLYKEDNTLAENSAVRIMSANLLVHFKDWGGSPVKPRAHRFAQAVKHYAPDVIGAQEMCGDWYKYLMPQISDNYEVAESKNSVFMENRTPLIYNKQKLNLVESRLVKYSQGDKNGCRVVTCGVFERKDDLKKFIVTSTHFDLIRLKDYEKEKSIMLKQVSEFFDVIESLKTKYDCPIFMTGDYNSMENEDSRYEGDEYSKQNDLTYYRCYGKACGEFVYKRIIEKYVDTKFVEGVEKKFQNTKGYLYDDPTWDHIFIANGDKASILTFRILASDYFLEDSLGEVRVSDHLPICIDALLS
ncbi:MAG: hypothetical protein OSJ74_00455 [Clostridia bacterium]|nr:hypothetical protein [Clostridia bacterium]